MQPWTERSERLLAIKCDVLRVVGGANVQGDHASKRSPVEYRRTFESGIRRLDPAIAVLAAEFAQMAAQLQRRENALRQEIAQLRIEIGEARKDRQVAEIVESDYFRSLRAQARDLRRKRE